MTPLSLARGVQSLHRLQHIARVLTQHGFGHVVEQLDLARFVPLWLRRRSKGDVTDASPAPSVGRRLARVANDLGPIFVKLGQMLATRPDLLPPEVLNELRSLQDRAEPFDSAQARSIIAEQLGVPMEQAFARVDEHPIACGSIGQVFRATLPQGRKVVIKVRRPHIEQSVRSDLQILRWLAEALERWVTDLRTFRPTVILEEFERSLLREMDFLHEAATTARIGEAFADDEGIDIPEVVWSHTTSAVLTLTALEGENIDTAMRADGEPLDRKTLATRLADVYLKQFFEVGTFHADPHPGNILVRPPARLGLIDFGQFGVVSDELAGHLLVMALGAVNRDVRLVADALVEMGAAGPTTHRTELVRDVQLLLNKYYGQPMSRLKISSIFAEAAEAVRRHDVTVPRDVVLMLKSLATVWGVALRLDPELDLVALLRPRIHAMIRQRLSPKRVLRAAGSSAWQVLNFLKAAPRQLREVLQQVSSGRWQLNVRHENLEPLGRDIDRSSNRLAFSIVIAAIVVGSSVVLSSATTREVFGIRIQTFGIFGYLFAGLLGMGLLWAIFRSGKLS